MPSTPRGRNEDITDEQIEQYLAGLDEGKKKILSDYALAKAADWGYSGVRAGSSTWEKAHREIVEDFIEQDIDFSTIEEPDYSG
jgi:hypothetical protein